MAPVVVASVSLCLHPENTCQSCSYPEQDGMYYASSCEYRRAESPCTINVKPSSADIEKIDLSFVFQRGGQIGVHLPRRGDQQDLADYQALICEQVRNAGPMPIGGLKRATNDEINAITAMLGFDLVAALNLANN